MFIGAKKIIRNLISIKSNEAPLYVPWAQRRVATEYKINPKTGIDTVKSKRNGAEILKLTLVH